MKNTFSLGVILSLVIMSCSKDGDLNFFTVNQDIEFGEQLDSAIRANPSEYPILERTGNEAVYAYMDGMLNDVLASNEILYGDRFEWEITIINSDVLNAFAAPGGKLYFYTGIMKYLRNTNELAGVLAHEVAHADRRHSTEQLTKAYGFSILASIILGDNSGKMTEIISALAQGAASLKFSRDDEYEADEYSIKYLHSVYERKPYNPKGIEGFFLQLKADGHTGTTFEFLSTHPSDDKRLEDIKEIYNSLSGRHEPYDTFETEYQAILNLLP